MGGDHNHDDEHSDDHGMSLQGLKILSIFILLLNGFLGAATPWIIAKFCTSKDDDVETRKKTHRRIQLVMKLLTCISVGVMISVVLTHLLPHAVSSLEESGHSLFKSDHGHDDDHSEEHSHSNETNHSDEHDDDDDHDDHDHAYPFAFLFAMCSFFTVFFVSSEINWYSVRKIKELKHIECDEKEESRLSSLIKLWSTVIGILCHSVIVGVTLGVSDSFSEVRTLLIVLIFHGYFEGMVVGALTVTAVLSNWKAVGFQLLFALGLPVGIAIGLGVEKEVDAVTRGVLECLSSGVLLWSGFVDSLPHLLGSHAHHAHGPLPLAELHNHVHHQNVDINKQSNNSPDQQMDDKPIPQKNALGSPVLDDEHDSSPTCKNTNKSIIQIEKSASEGSSGTRSDDQDEEQYLYDDHADDDSLTHRLACYACLLFGAGVQAVLAIWA